MFKQLETERLFIRPLEINDKAFILELVNTQGWLQFIGDRNIKNNKEAEIYIQNILDNKNYFYNVFELKETNQPVGIITFLYRDIQKYPDIGFAMLPIFNKKGYAFEASKKYLNEILKEKSFEKIIAITKPENINSINLIEKLGLKYAYNYIDNSEVLNLYEMTINE